MSYVEIEVLKSVTLAQAYIYKALVSSQTKYIEW